MHGGGRGAGTPVTSNMMGPGKGSWRRAKEQGVSFLGTQGLPVGWACEGRAAWEAGGLEEARLGPGGGAGAGEQGGDGGRELEGTGELGLRLPESLHAGPGPRWEGLSLPTEVTLSPSISQPSSRAPRAGLCAPVRKAPMGGVTKQFLLGLSPPWPR